MRPFAHRSSFRLNIPTTNGVFAFFNSENSMNTLIEWIFFFKNMKVSLNNKLRPKSAPKAVRDVRICPSFARSFPLLHATDQASPCGRTRRRSATHCTSSTLNTIQSQYQSMGTGLYLGHLPAMREKYLTGPFWILAVMISVVSVIA